MLTSYTQAYSIVVVGAGPYGLSLAAHLRNEGLPFRIFGRPMETWATQMPAGMCLRSDPGASNLSAGAHPFTFSEHVAGSGNSTSSSATTPIAVEDFVGYGMEFARRFVPDLEPVHIRSVDRQGDLFRVTTGAGEQLLSRRVVLATGLNSMHHVPREFRHLPPSRVTHPSQHGSYSDFHGRDVTVLGSGASALNAAVLLHESGARVTLLARAPKLQVDAPCVRTSPPDAGRSKQPKPDLYRYLPDPLRRIADRSEGRPCGDRSLSGRLEGFSKLFGCRIHAVEPADGACERLRITLTDNEGQVRQHLTSHLIAATGYRYSKERLQILSQSLREQLRVGREGAPKLNRGFESSVSGLHFIGPLAAPSFGASLRSISGSAFAARRVTETLQQAMAQENQRQESRERIGVLARRQRSL